MNKTKENNQNNHQFIIFTTTGYACHLPGGCSWSCSHISNESLTDLHPFSSTWQLELRHVAVTQRSSIKKKTTPSSWGCCSQLWKSIPKWAKNTPWLSTQPDVHPHGEKRRRNKTKLWCASSNPLMKTHWSPASKKENKRKSHKIHRKGKHFSSSSHACWSCECM